MHETGCKEQSVRRRLEPPRHVVTRRVNGPDAELTLTTFGRDVCVFKSVRPEHNTTSRRLRSFLTAPATDFFVALALLNRMVLVELFASIAAALAM